MNCPKCGAILEEDAKFCASCGTRLDDLGETSSDGVTQDKQNNHSTTFTPQKTETKKERKANVLGLIVGTLIIVIGLSRFLYSNYCYKHYLLYDDDAQEEFGSDPVYSHELKISNVKLTSNSSYTIAEGTITNNSDQTVSFVEIKGAFKTSSGSVVDTDWTYAVGSEGLAPGESCKWRLSVSKDWSIKDCTVTVIDFDY